MKSDQLEYQESCTAASRQHKFNDSTSLPLPAPNHSRLNVTLLISLSSQGNKEIYLVFRAEANSKKLVLGWFGSKTSL